MTALFVDTSALVKRYIVETGSVWVRNLVRSSTPNVILISEIAPVEMFSAFSRLHREGNLSDLRQTRLENVFLQHMKNEYLVVPVNGSVLLQSRQLVSQYPLRTLDAIQLASALNAAVILGETITFVSADKRLLAVAIAEGLKADDPNAH
jgi:hypothetical protein